MPNYQEEFYPCVVHLIRSMNFKSYASQTRHTCTCTNLWLLRHYSLVNFHMAVTWYWLIFKGCIRTISYNTVHVNTCSLCLHLHRQIYTLGKHKAKIVQWRNLAFLLYIHTYITLFPYGFQCSMGVLISLNKETIK